MAAALAVYLRPRLLAVLFMGFASGLPLALTGATLAVWLTESGLRFSNVGLFALVGTAYNLKFLWAPLIDRLPAPIPIGRRRGWALTIQLLLALALVALGHADPAVDPWRTALFAVAVAFLSASQDIVIDAYRVELLKEEEQGAGAAATQFGYRIGMLAAGAGALYVAAGFGWTAAYLAMAGLMGVGMATVLLTPEPGESLKVTAPDGMLAWLREAVVAPFADFLTRPVWWAVLLFVVLFKLGDALAGVMSSPFYVAMGFSKIEIANISKIFGVGASMVGLALGGILVYRLGILKSLLVTGVLQALSNLMFAIQAMAGYDPALLTLTIAVENVTGAMGSAAFVAYLSSLCNIAYTATQYALLSSFAAVARTNLAAWGGFLVEGMGWVPFFLASTVAAVPGLLLLVFLMRRFRV